MSDEGQFPPRFEERLREIIPEALFGYVLGTFQPRRPVFRVNPLRGDVRTVLDRIASLGLQIRGLPHLSDTFVLENGEKRILTESSLVREGRVYVQSVASMVPPIVLDPRPGERVLDLAAAPGSKTSQIAVLMERSGTLIANEPSRNRFFKMLANLTTLGVYEKGDPFCQLTMMDGVRVSRSYGEIFDKILLDAPCSGEARFIAGEVNSFGYWSERKIKELAKLQFRLLKGAWSALLPGGRLVYSTCTLAPEENELVVARFLDWVEGGGVLEEVMVPGFERLVGPSSWRGKAIPASVTARTVRLLPDQLSESFFIAAFRKGG